MIAFWLARPLAVLVKGGDHRAQRESAITHHFRSLAPRARDGGARVEADQGNALTAAHLRQLVQLHRFFVHVWHRTPLEHCPNGRRSSVVRNEQLPFAVAQLICPLTQSPADSNKTPSPRSSSPSSATSLRPR